MQVEAQFTTRSISSQKTRFDYVVSSLSPEFATEVRDLLLKPPSENQYDVLKAQLVKRTAASEQRKLQQLISGEELGDRKPTQLLRCMQKLLGNKLGSTTDTNSFLRELFLQRLPASIRMVLASADCSTTIDKLAEMADKVMEAAVPTAPNVSAVSHVTADHPELKQLREDVARLTELIQTLSIQSRPHYPRSTSRSRHCSVTPTSQHHDSQLCWYHTKFGEAVQKCKKPRSWGNFPAAH